MRWPAQLSIPGKLVLVTMGAAGIGLFLASAAFSIYDIVSLRGNLRNNLTVLADVLGNNSTAALSFGDTNTANEVLSALRAQPQIEAGALYDRNGDLFVRYSRADTTAPVPARPGTVGARFGESRLVVVRPVILEQRPIGTLYLRSDLSELSARSRVYGTVVLIVLAVTLLVTLAVSTRAQRLISRPIQALAQAAHTISKQRDYSIRAEKTSADELGQLTDAFNEMVAAVEARDHRVRQAYDALLKEVAERQRAEEALRLDEVRLEALLRLNQMTETPLAELTEFALQEAVQLTRSRVGSLGFLDNGGGNAALHLWPLPTGLALPITMPVAALGIWTETLRQRKPQIVNDGPPLPVAPGLPPPASPSRRYICVPVFDGDRIVALIGVADKDEPYDDADVRQLTLLMQGMWRLVQRRRAEDELRRHRDHLEELVSERTAALRQANERLGREVGERRRAEIQLRRTAADLQRSNRELEQFAYVASHDLREPLRMVASYVQLLEHRYRDKLDADATQFINFAVEGARRMQALIDDLLAYARIETRAKPPAPIDLNRIVAVVRENLQIATAEANATVAVDAQLPTVRGDDTQLTQLFQNLLGNALKFRRPDAPPKIAIHAERQKDDWLFCVSDNGIGIDPQYHERIFVIFQRLHSREQYPGTGIGLALCKKIVERHGGRIWVQSALGQGATFYFTLPGQAEGVS
jgi:signal transduction histidine kinase/HAMP domain-containing protein